MAVKMVFYGPTDSGRMLFLAEAKRRFPESICLDLKAAADEQQMDMLRLVGEGTFPHEVFLSAGKVDLSEFKKFDIAVVRVLHSSWEAYIKHLKTPHRYNLQALDEYLLAYDTISNLPDEPFAKTFVSDRLYGPDRDAYMDECWAGISVNSA